MRGWGFFRAALLAVLTGLLVAGVATLVLRAARPSGGIEILLPTPSPREAIVYVSGAVAKPGLYTLREGERVADAIEAAGGATGDADVARVNFAARLLDGEQVHVPARGEPAGGAAPGTPQPIDLNSATLEALERLPGIGVVRARAIVDFRSKNGPFARVEDLLLVEGIGPTTLSRLRPLVTVR